MIPGKKKRIQERKAAGMHDHNGPLTVTYFGALLFSLPPASEKAPL